MIETNAIYFLPARFPGERFRVVSLKGMHPGQVVVQTVDGYRVSVDPSELTLTEN